MMDFAFKDEDEAIKAIISSLEDLNLWGLNDLLCYSLKIPAVQAVKFDKPKSKKLSPANLCEYVDCENEMIGVEPRFNYTYCEEHKNIAPVNFIKKLMKHHSQDTSK